MDRREFLKTCAALGMTVGIPSIVSVNCEPGVQLVELVDYRIDERWLNEAIAVGRVVRVEGNRAWVECSFDVEKAWRAVALEDSRGRVWTTGDGERWTCGGQWFEAGE